MCVHSESCKHALYALFSLFPTGAVVAALLYTHSSHTIVAGNTIGTIFDYIYLLHTLAKCWSVQPPAQCQPLHHKKCSESLGY